MIAAPRRSRRVEKHAVSFFFKISRPTSLLAALVSGALVLGTTALAESGTPSFDAAFEATTVRMDLVRAGDAAAVTWALDRVGLEGGWAGPRKNLVDTMELGQLRFSLRRASDGTLIFSRGFSSLYSEWLVTGEAKSGMRRAGTETLRFPRPREAVELVLEERDASGHFAETARFPFDPTDYALAAWPPAEAAERLDLIINGDPADKVDLLIVADGYPDDQAEKFRRDAGRLVRAVFGEQPYDEHAELFNVVALRAPAALRGPAEPRKGYFPPGALTSFDTFRSPRYLVPSDLPRLQDIAGQVGHDALVVLVNTSRYGGGGVFRQFTVFTADGEYDSYLFLHEFGHGFAGLADEYYDSAVAYETDPSAIVEPWEPNLSAAPHAESLKWRHLVDDGVPLPTPDTAEYDGVVGAFEGGGYLAHGLFRPTRTCKMKDKGALPYCPVCSEAIVRMIRFTADLPKR